MNFGVYASNSGRVVNAQLKVVIADITLTNPGSFEAIPIPAGFDALEVVWSLRSTHAATSGAGRVFLNGDTTDGNYSTQYIQGVITTVATGRLDYPQLRVLTGATSTTGDYGTGIISIPVASQTGVRRMMIWTATARRDATSQDVNIASVNWESTEPITSITLRTDNYPTALFAAGSRVQVFGLGTFAVALAR